MDSLILVPEAIYMNEKTQCKKFSTGFDPEVYIQWMMRCPPPLTASDAVFHITL